MVAKVAVVLFNIDFLELLKLRCDRLVTFIFNELDL